MERIDACLMALRRIIRATEIHRKEVAHHIGITPVQLRVVQIIAETGATTGSAIAKRMHVSQATVSALIDRLEQAGLVERRRDAGDKRQTLLTLTPAGQATHDAAPDALQQQLVRKFQGLETWEQAMLVASLERIVAMLDAGDEPVGALLDTHEI